MTALLIAGPIHPPKEKYSLSGPTHPPKVKYSLQLLTITVSGPQHPPKVKIFSETSNASYSSYTETGTSTDIHEEFTTPSQTSSKVTSSAYSSETFRTTTSSQSDLFTETATEYDASSEVSSRETSRPSSPESGNLTVRSVYSPLPEMAIVHKTMQDAIHAVRDQQGRAVTRRFLQQQEIAVSKLKCMSQIRKTSTPDPPPPKSNAFPRRARARSEMANGTTSGSSEESDCENNPRKAKFLALKRRFESTHLSTSSDEEAVKRARLFPSRTSTPSQK